MAEVLKFIPDYVTKRYSVYSGSNPATSTSYINTTGVGHNYYESFAGFERSYYTKRGHLTPNTTGFNEEAAALLLSGGKTVPEAADASRFSLTVDLQEGITVSCTVRIPSSEASRYAPLKYDDFGSGDIITSYPANTAHKTVNLTFEQARKAYLWGVNLAPNSEFTSGATVDPSYTKFSDTSQLTVELINPAAKGEAADIIPAAHSVVVGNQDAEIRYTYRHRFGGYAQTFLGVKAVSIDTGEEIVIAKKRAVSVADGKTNTFTIPADTLSAGTWDLTISCAPAASANYYGENDPFWLEGQTVRYTVKDNPTAGGITCDGKPVPLVGWESSAQAAWQLRFGDYDSGARAGSQTSFIVPRIFRDGAYPVQVRTASSAGEWSAWTEVFWATVRNVPPEGSVALSAEPSGPNVRLIWEDLEPMVSPILDSGGAAVLDNSGETIDGTTFEAMADKYAVFRDGELIGVTTELLFTDKTGGGEYQVFAMAGRYYIPSNVVEFYPRIAADMISTDGGATWIVLKYTPEVKNEPEDVRTEITYYYYAGRTKPMAVNTGQTSRSKSFSYIFKNRGAARALRNLNGSEVVLKNTMGERIRGVMESLNYQDTRAAVTVSFTIRETDEEEDHVEYTV